jgi:hypothetical protein
LSSEIPDGMTNQHQPLDVMVNKPLKGYLRKKHEARLLSENVTLTPSGNIKNCLKKTHNGRRPFRRRSQEKHWRSRSKNDALQTHLMANRMLHYESVLISTAPT